MKILISPLAEKQLRKLPKIVQIAIVRKVPSLSSAGPTGEEKLQGYNNIYRVRVGDYRIVYRRTVVDVYIILIRHRKDVYDFLKQLLG